MRHLYLRKPRADVGNCQILRQRRCRSDLRRTDGSGHGRRGGSLVLSSKINCVKSTDHNVACVASLRKELISMARLDLPRQKKVLANAEDLAISETRHCTPPERLESRV